MKEGLTKEIQLAVGKMQILKCHTPVIENFTPLNKYEFDVCSINGDGKLYEFEVKISRSDFLRQKERNKAEEYGVCFKSRENYSIVGSRIIYAPNYFSYCCPDGLIKETEIPEFAGLYYLINGEIVECRAPKMIHNELHEKYPVATIIKRALRTYSQRTFLGCTLLTLENREIKRRNEQRLAERNAELQALIDKHKLKSA